MSSSLNKRIRSRHEEEIGPQDLFGFDEFLLRLFKVKIDVQRLDEIRHRVVILVSFLPHDPSQVFELLLVQTRVPAAVSVRDDGGGEVAQDPGAIGLNGIDVWGGEEEFAEGVASGFVIEEWEEGPMDQPRTVLQLGQGIVEEFGVDGFFDFVDFFHGYFPVRGQYLRGQFAPCS